MLTVLDTSVLVAGLRSRRGASFQILSMLGSGAFETAVSVPLVLEYEAVLKSQLAALKLTIEDVDAIVDYMCRISARHEVYFLWRPMLRGPGDEFVLELAVGAGCEAIVTHNVRDFDGAARFSVEVVTPGQFLQKVRSRP